MTQVNKFSARVAKKCIILSCRKKKTNINMLKKKRKKIDVNNTGIFLVLMSETSRLHYNNNNILLFKNKFAKCNNVSLFSVYDIKEQKNF